MRMARLCLQSMEVACHGGALSSPLIRELSCPVRLLRLAASLSCELLLYLTWAVSVAVDPVPR